MIGPRLTVEITVRALHIACALPPEENKDIILLVVYKRIQHFPQVGRRTRGGDRQVGPQFSGYVQFPDRTIRLQRSCKKYKRFIGNRIVHCSRNPTRRCGPGIARGSILAHPCFGDGIEIPGSCAGCGVEQIRCADTEGGNGCAERQCFAEPVVRLHTHVDISDVDSPAGVGA